MACPMGFTIEDLERRIREDAQKEMLDQRFPDAKPFNTIAEPREIRKLAKEAIYRTGAQYALLLQWLHPGLARAAIEHFDFEYHLAEQLQALSRFLTACTYGTEYEKRAICHAIHKKNAVVVGEGYQADDPELHKWTAATLFMSLKIVYEAFFRKLTQREEERLYKESAIYGTSLCMPADWWPETLDDFYAYWNRNIEALPVTPWALALSEQLMNPKHVSVGTKLYMPVARLYTAQWLPPRLQKEYKLHNSILGQGTYKVLTSCVHLTYSLVPKRLRHRRYEASLADLRGAIKEIELSSGWTDSEKTGVEDINETVERIKQSSGWAGLV